MRKSLLITALIALILLGVILYIVVTFVLGEKQGEIATTAAGDAVKSTQTQPANNPPAPAQKTSSVTTPANVIGPTTEVAYQIVFDTDGLSQHTWEGVSDKLAYLENLSQQHVDMVWVPQRFPEPKPEPVTAPPPSRPVEQPQATRLWAASMENTVATPAAPSTPSLAVDTDWLAVSELLRRLMEQQALHLRLALPDLNLKIPQAQQTPIVNTATLPANAAPTPITPNLQASSIASAIAAEIAEPEIDHFWSDNLKLLQNLINAQRASVHLFCEQQALECFKDLAMPSNLSSPKPAPKPLLTPEDDLSHLLKAPGERY